jgi:hypothetical protein
MPMVTVWPRPKGLPSATTYSPTRSLSRRQTLRREERSPRPDAEQVDQSSTAVLRGLRPEVRRFASRVEVR